MSVEQRARQLEAGRGSRSKKSGQSQFFVGYKTHTVRGVLRIDGKLRTVPLHSQARAAGVADVRLLKPLLNFVKRRLEFWPLRFVVADQGYISHRRFAFLRRHWQTGVIMRPRKDMAPPAGTAADGCPLCAFGHRLQWVDYDPADEALIYRGAPENCRCCPLAGTCAKQFEYFAGAHETFWGMVPSHSRLSQTMLKQLRPLVEPGFNTSKNRFRLKDFFLNSRQLTKILIVMSDVLSTLDLLAQERPARGRETRNALIADLESPEIRD